MDATPYRWRPTVDPDAAAAAAARRAELDAAWEAGAPMRRRTIAAGPSLRDVDAAVGCRCSCHPRAGDVHDGGVTCPCQLTVEERRQVTAGFLETLAGLGADLGLARQAARDHDRAVFRCRELGVELRSYGGAAPLVFRGLVDGYGFALRARHDVWQVIVAGTARPDADVWVDPQDDDLVIAEGAESALCRPGETWPDPAVVVTVAVAAVRRWMLRGCDHADAGPGDRFCRRCGAPVDPRFGG